MSKYPSIQVFKNPSIQVSLSGVGTNESVRQQLSRHVAPPSCCPKEVKEVFAIEKSVLHGNYQVLLCPLPGGTTETGLGREAGEVKIKKAAVIETNFFPGQGQTETFSQSALMIY